MCTRAFEKTAAAICLLVVVAASTLVVAQDLTAPALREPSSATEPPIAQPPASQAPGSQSSTPPAVEAWRREMARTPFPKPGCYTSSYPRTEWQELPCSTAKAVPHGGTLNGDYSAQVLSQSISSATGSFDSVIGATGETDSLAGANNFSLQLNVLDNISSPLCDNSSCFGRKQYVYDSPGNVYIQYWLINQNQCPSATIGGNSWNYNNGKTTPPSAPGCYINGFQTPAPTQPITNLAALQLTGSLQSVELDINQPPYPKYPANDGVDFLGAGTQWTTAEFNVVGLGNGSTATLSPSPGTTVVVRTSVDNGTTNFPGAISGGITVESNTLTLIPPACPIGDPGAIVGEGLPGIVFTESNSPGVKSSCQCATGSNWDPNSATCVRCPARFTWDSNSAACLCTSPKTIAEACGTLQCAGNVPDGCGGTIACPANCSSGEVCGPPYGGVCCTPPVLGKNLPNQCPPICPACPLGYSCAAGEGAAYGVCVFNTRCEVGSHYCGLPEPGKGECLPQGQPCPTRSTCTPKTTAEACGGLQCAGNVSDGCGGTIACPASCPSGEVCNPGAKACCTPKTTAEACGASQCAGDVSNGCGGTIACPANCPSGEVCNADAKACLSPNTCPASCGPEGCIVVPPGINNNKSGGPLFICKNRLN
jgi:hypothetical protein